MKKFFIALFMSVVVVSARGQQTKTIVEFEGEDIYGLIADGAFDIRISQGDDTKVSIDIREDQATKLEVSKTAQGYIRLSYGSDVGRYFKGKNKPFVTIVVKELRFLKIDGACTAIGKGKYSASEICEVMVGGTSNLDFIDISAPKVTFDVTGGKIDEISVNTPELRVGTSGAGRAIVKGACKNASVSATGTSSIEILHLKSEKIVAEVSGLSGVKALVMGTAEVTKSGTASFRYTGAGKVTGDAKPLK